jgi:hypothetical protein
MALKLLPSCLYFCLIQIVHYSQLAKSLTKIDHKIMYVGKNCIQKMAGNAQLGQKMTTRRGGRYLKKPYFMVPETRPL